MAERIDSIWMCEQSLISLINVFCWGNPLVNEVQSKTFLPVVMKISREMRQNDWFQNEAPARFDFGLSLTKLLLYWGFQRRPLDVFNVVYSHRRRSFSVEQMFQSQTIIFQGPWHSGKVLFGFFEPNLRSRRLVNGWWRFNSSLKGDFFRLKKKSWKNYHFCNWLNF